MGLGPFFQEVELRGLPYLIHIYIDIDALKSGGSEARVCRCIGSIPNSSTQNQSLETSAHLGMGPNLASPPSDLPG